MRIGRRWAPNWSAVRHKLFVHGLSRLAPYYVVNEFPKSGGSWLAEMLSDALEVPFRRNVPIQFERGVTHGHFLSPIGLRKAIIMWRDPRDVLVSFYYHCFFINERHNTELVRLMKICCEFDDYANIRANLPAFIRFVTQTPLTPRFSWPDFARVWASRQGAIHTSYEALRANTSGELARVIYLLVGRPLDCARALDVAQRHSFSRAKKAAEKQRPAGAEISFVREGALGGWRKHFTPESEAVLREWGYVEPMHQLGYDI